MSTNRPVRKAAEGSSTYDGHRITWEVGADGTVIIEQFATNEFLQPEASSIKIGREIVAAISAQLALIP